MSRGRSSVPRRVPRTRGRLRRPHDRQRQHRVDGLAELPAERELDARDRPEHQEREEPHADGAVQLPVDAWPRLAEVHAQRPPPPPDARPPDDQSRGEHQDEGQGADAVDQAACLAGQQVEVQILQPGDPGLLRHLADDLARHRIRERGHQLVALHEVRQVGRPGGPSGSRCRGAGEADTTPGGSTRGWRGRHLVGQPRLRTSKYSAKAAFCISGRKTSAAPVRPIRQT